MALPLTYNFRNVFVRWRATLATILGIGLVVANLLVANLWLATFTTALKATEIWIDIAVKKTILKVGTGAKANMDVSPG